MIVTDDNFDSIINSHKVVLIDFWAPWCGPCTKYSPILDEIAEENNIWLGKINVDENVLKTKEYQVSSIPTVVVFEDGKAVSTIIGALPKHKLLEKISEWI